MRVLLYLLNVWLVSADNEIPIATNLFAVDLYKSISRNTNRTFLVSPLTAEISLSSLQFGCRGATGKEIRSALHLPNQNEIQTGFKTLIPKLTRNDFYVFHTLTKIYVRRNFPVRKNFARVAKQVFRSESERIDFGKRVKAARRINNWLERHTGRRGSVINAANLGAKTRMVVVNALVFKANWFRPFSENLTKKEFFFVNATTSVLAEMMYHSGPDVYNFYESEVLNAKFLEIPFGGDEALMVLVLPNLRGGLQSLENQIETVLKPFTTKLEFVDVVVPKFQIETKVNFKFILKTLEVNRAFNPSQADFSGIAGRKGDLFLSEIIQKVFVNVSENGIDATASAIDDEVLRSYSGGVQSIKQFRADHPFLFYVKINNVIAFIGRVLDPTL